MAKMTPTVRGEVLVYHRDEHEQVLPVGTTDWYAWLETATSFAFVSEIGSFTARRERSGHGRGGWYWRAYRKQQGQLLSRYLGKSEALTLAHMNAIAAQLAGEENAAARAATQASHLPDGEPVTEALTTREPKPGRFSNLPVQLTSFIGREQELADSSALLHRPQVRLLTLTGPGGVGKTRLALQLAAQLQHEFAGGVCFVSLAPISEIELVVPTLAKALGVKDVPGQPLVEAVKNTLREHSLLLLIDNFEQVVSAAPLLTELLVACRALKIVVTSRAVLHLHGEQVFPVPPLALPDATHLPEGELLSQYAAIALFCARAQEVKPDFHLTAANARAIANICIRLDGLPLALELAAARSNLLPPQELLVRLQQRQPLLHSCARDVPTRQQTLRKTIQWSYDLLEPWEQALFRHLAVFVGGCTLEAAEAVCSALEDRAVSILEGVASLLDKSLVRQSEQKGGKLRLFLLETVREFGLDCLLESEEARAAQQAHALYFLRFAETAEPEELYGAAQVSRLDALEREHDNLRAALRWLLESRASEHALRLCVALARFWAIRGYIAEGREWLLKTLELPEQEHLASPMKAKALNWAGWLTLLQGDLATATALFQESLELSQHMADQPGIAMALHRLGFIASSQGDDATACSLLEESVRHYQLLGDTNRLAYSLMVLGALATGYREPGEVRAWLEKSLLLFQASNNQEGIAWSLYTLARLRFVLGDWEHASPFKQEAFTLFRSLGIFEEVGQMLLLLGQVDLRHGEAASAQALFQEGLQLFQENGNRRGAAHALFSLACVAVLQRSREAARCYWDGSLAQLHALRDIKSIIAALEALAAVAVQQQEARWAAHLWGAAETLRETAQSAISSTVHPASERSIAAARAQLDPATFAAAWAAGRTLPPEQAFAVRDKPPVSLSQEYPGDLSQREIEVLRLLARGLTNGQIAEQLVLSPRTVDAHLRSIYSKLAVTSRTAATRYASDHQLI